jgi:hypothetical protein
MIAGLLALAIGALVAQRLKLIALTPLMLLTILLAIAATAHAGARWSVWWTALTVIVGLQLGYLLGAWIRYLRILARRNRLRSTSEGYSWSSQWPLLRRSFAKLAFMGGFSGHFLRRKHTQWGE